MTRFASGSSPGDVWASTLRGLFFSDAGVSLKVNDSSPVQLSMDDPAYGKGICLEAKKLVLRTNRI